MVMPALALEVHGVEELLGHLPLGEGPRPLHQPVGERGLAVVDVGDDGEVADVLHRDRSGPGPPCRSRGAGSCPSRATRLPPDAEPASAFQRRPVRTPVVLPADDHQVEPGSPKKRPRPCRHRRGTLGQAKQPVHQDAQRVLQAAARTPSASGQATTRATRPLTKARRKSSSLPSLEDVVDGPSGRQALGECRRARRSSPRGSWRSAQSASPRRSRLRRGPSGLDARTHSAPPPRRRSAPSRPWICRQSASFDSNIVGPGLYRARMALQPASRRTPSVERRIRG